MGMENFFEIENLKKSFDGVTAVDGVNLNIKKGIISSIIGPNGAGKTTLFNLMSGYYKADSGRIFFLGKEISRYTPKMITQIGIARSFQIVNIFPSLTVYENVMVAILAKNGKSLNCLTPAKTYFRDDCYSLLERIGLTVQAQQISGHLAHGNQKRLEVGLALAMRPTLLLLDEPTSGMAAEEKGSILGIIKDMCDREESTIFMCEHDMGVIFDISDTIWVLHKGCVIAHGTADEIRNNETVQKVYLGEKE